MASKGLNNIFGLGLNVPYFDGSIGRACDEEALIEDILEENVFYLSFMGVGKVKMPDFVLFVLCKFLHMR